MTTKKTEWIAEGAPEQLTDFLDAAVETMHTKAVENNYLYKDKDVTDGAHADADPIAAGMSDILDVDTSAENVEKDADEASNDVADTSADVTVDADTTEADAGTDADADADGAEVDAEVQADTNVSAVQKAFDDALMASLKAYHEVVVQPLQERIVELEALTKAANDEQPQDVMSSIGLLPPAHAAASIKKAFSAAPDKDAGNEEATEKELGDVVTDVSAEDADLAPTSPASENLLTGF